MKRSLCLVLGLLATAHSPLAQQPAPPDWTAGAVVYQLFPERFANGDPTNDPTWESLDFPERIDPDLWTVSDWTADWYSRQPWERTLGPDFYADGVFQRRYGGDLQGVIDRIPYLDSLGVNTVYFNPVFHAASLHKYDATSFHHIDPHFGPDPEGDRALIASETADPATWVWTAADRLFFEMLAAMRARGIRVILDGVFNHTGTRFWAFQDVERNQQASPYADWYKVTAWDDPATPESEFDWEGWWGFKPLAEFTDTADSTDLHPGVKAHVFDATRRWLDPDGDGDPSDGIDGWRLDVSDEVPAGFWQDWTAHVKAINPDAVTIAEVWGDATEYLDETGLDGTMNYHGFAIPLDGFLFDRREPASRFGRHVVDAYAAYGEHAPALLTLTSSHDTARLASMVVNGARGANYDREGSPRYHDDYLVRAPSAAEREVQRQAVTLMMAMPGMPTVYYGDEAGMWGADDPDDRKPMVWPDLAYADEALDPRARARTPDPVAFDHELFDFYRRAIALRRGDAVLQRGSLRLLAAVDDAETVVFERALGGERRVVAVNRSDASQFVALPEHRGFAPMVPLFASTAPAERLPGLNVVILDDGSTTVGVRVPPRTTVIYRPADGDDVRPHGLDE